MVECSSLLLSRMFGRRNKGDLEITALHTRLAIDDEVFVVCWVSTEMFKVCERLGVGE